ncbi:Pentatricopeptide repeat protein [Zostera marina]|uniref:Pentatricopeptide repeat protein n=1 Tax=Zostera marina TaxID=29655 RepID=A0A0K9P6R8_ZOSMR|nr:Pentatricopeptide repeat protein [Zostera marina]
MKKPKTKVAEAKNLIVLLGRCRNLGDVSPIHALIVRQGYAGNDYIINTLLRAYFQTGSSHSTFSIFDSIASPNLHHWNTMIRGFTSNDCFLDVTDFYHRMRQDGLFPNDFTFPFVLKACTRLLDVDLGTKIHTQVVKSGFSANPFVKTGLVSLYAKSGCLSSAQNLFDEMGERETNVVSWTAIISGYIEQGNVREALVMFRNFLHIGLKPDSFVLVKLLTACSRMGDLEGGDWICRYIESMDLIKNNVFVATATVDMYSKSGCMSKARMVFDGMIDRDEITWNTMVAGYSSNGLPMEALSLFSEMQKAKIKPDCYTMVGVLSACARLGALEYGESLIRKEDEEEFLSNPVLATAVIDMYIKCGNLPRAWTLFNVVKIRDVILFNTMITGLAMNGHGKLSFAIFAQIEKVGIAPSGNTLVGLLSACSHAGMVEEGRRYFQTLIGANYSILPRIEHYGCMVDLLGRAGLLDEAQTIITQMPREIAPNAVVWGSLLHGCRIHRNTNLAEYVLKKLIALEPENSGNYVLLSNLYTSVGRYEDSAKLRLSMRHRNIQKLPGRSWIEADDGKVHEFLVGDRTHPWSDRIYLKLKELGIEMRELGYVPTTEVVLFDVEEEEKEQSVGEHSEKLAVVFGLLKLPLEDTIRISKNLRVCTDCHSFIKLISKITGRQIVIRDNNRFHSFNDGFCSCNDYW